MIKYIKKHKLSTFIIFVYIVFIAVAYFLYNLFLGNNGMPVYGNRLDGIEKVMITNEQFKKISEEIKKEDFVLRATDPYLNGKILKIVVDVQYKTSANEAKPIVNKVLKELTDDQKNFFDIEVFINKYYDCNLVVSGLANDEDVFVEDVTVKFAEDLSKNPYTLNYGITDVNKKDYNKKQEFKVTKDGEHIIYGFTQDKSAEQTCSIKVVKKATSNKDNIRKIYSNSLTVTGFPVIGYRSAKAKDFVWVG